MGQESSRGSREKVMGCKGGSMSSIPGWCVVGALLSSQSAGPHPQTCFFFFSQTIPEQLL